MHDDELPIKLKELVGPMLVPCVNHAWDSSDLFATLMPRKEDTRFLGVGDEIGAGDSYLVADLLPAEWAETAFDKLKDEVKWQTMYHRGKCT